MLMRRGSGRPVVAELGRELLATPGGWVAPAARSAPVATAAADGDTELAEAVAAVYRAYTTSLRLSLDHELVVYARYGL